MGQHPIVKTMVEGLVDNRNSDLLEELEKNYNIEVELVNDTNEYGCYSIDNTSIIYVPEFEICADSFTHELLHIYLRSKNIYIGARLKRKLQPSKILSKIYTESLLEHIGNCLDHIKMLPIYLDMGFDRSKFILDYELNKCTKFEIEQIKKNWKEESFYNPKAINYYLRKYFSIQACPNENFDYQYCLKELRQIDEPLFSINEKLVKRWSEMKINPSDILEDDYIIIAEDYIAEMEDWARLKQIATPNEKR